MCETGWDPARAVSLKPGNLRSPGLRFLQILFRATVAQVTARLDRTRQVVYVTGSQDAIKAGVPADVLC